MESKFARERGHEEDHFELPVNENLTCSICLNVLNNPKSCRNNQHYFCFGCIGQHLENSHTCPKCMEELTPATLVEPPRVLLNMILALRIKCNHRARGCPKYVQLDKLQNHVDHCGFGPATCGNEGCGMDVNRSDKVRHETELCKFRTILCSGCGELKKQVEELKRKQEMAKKNSEEIQTKMVEKQREMEEKQKEIDEKQREMDEKQREMNEKQKEVDRNIAAVMESQLKIKEALKDGACKIGKIFDDLQLDSLPARNPPQNLGSRINYDIIIMGGSGDFDEKITNSVEFFSCKEGRWIDLPPLVVPRLLASSVVYKNQVIVSGGRTNLDTSKDANTEPTDSIEILNLERCPLKWEISYAKLPCPLSYHQTFIYKGKLLVVSSEMICQVSLSPPQGFDKLYDPDEFRFMSNAELVNEKIYIFHGKSSYPQRVLIYDLLVKECRAMPRLPFAVWNMSTAVFGEKIILLGGKKEEFRSECDTGDVIIYDTQTGESEMLPAMKHARSFSAAVLRDDVIVVIGGYYNSVEFYDFRTNTWHAVKATKKFRYQATAVVSPVNII